jgi:hypothetical protein
MRASIRSKRSSPMARLPVVSLFLCLLSPCFAEAYRISAAQMPYFLCDDRVVEDRWGIERFVVPLERHSENPLIVLENPWEGSGPHMGGTALLDPEDGLTKIWYCVFNRHNYDNKLPFSYNVCYAESKDGLTFSKPDLGVFDYEGSTANNCIKLGTDKTQNIDVCLNPRPDLYPGKFLAIHNQKGGVRVSSSQDGKTFTFLTDRPAIPYHSDTHNNFLYDPVRELWFLFCRPRAYAGDHKRRVSMQTSEDLIEWTHEENILVPEEDDPREFYGMTVFRLGDLFFGSLQDYDRETGDLHPEIAWSGDGRHWSRIPGHPALLDRGESGGWDAGMICLAESPILVGREMRFYYGGFELDHNQHQNPAAIGLATAELNRLVGLRPTEEEGFILTRPFTPSSQAILRLNAKVEEGGEIRAEVRTDFNKPVEGFTFEDSDPVTESGFDRPLTWGGKELSEAEGEDLRLNFRLRNAELFTCEW